MRKYVFLFLSLCFLSLSAQENKMLSYLEIFNVETGQRTVLKEYPYRIEAPNWTNDAQSLIYNSGGKLYRIDIHHPETEVEINTSFATSCNNDHLLSFAGDKIAISHHTKEDGKSRIYILPITGGDPTLITAMAPSYLHGWSPDGHTITYCAERNGNYDVYSIPAIGGVETRLTDAEGLDDGPEYSPDGDYIWFNSVRTGLMQLWRMKADGSEQTQMTVDETRNSWFPHISPDGKQVLFICYQKDDVAPGDHPPGKHVEIRMMPATGGEPETLVKLFGGQGSLNVSSWSPDSKWFAFVSYSE